MHDNTEYYKQVIAAWQVANDRRDAHKRFKKISGIDLSYRSFMSDIRYLRYNKGIKLQTLGLPCTNWQELREYATTLS